MVSIAPSPKVTDKAYVNSPPPSRSWTSLEDGRFSSDDEDQLRARATSSSSMEDLYQDELNTVEVVFNKIYLDPLQEVLESIDAEAAGILRTGKLTIHGEAGDMNILQPLLFSLQATEKDLHVLLPQLLQNPFFTPREDNFTAAVADNFLQFGCIRLGVMVDQVIYKLLSTHCCKGPGSRQADMLIDTALKTVYTLPSAMERFIANSKNPPPLLFGSYNIPEQPDTSDEEESDVYDNNLSPVTNFLTVGSNNSRDQSKFSHSSGVFSNTTSSTSNLAGEDFDRSPTTISEEEVVIRPRQLSGGQTDHFPPTRLRTSSLRQIGGKPERKGSIFQAPPLGSFDDTRRPSDQSSVASFKLLQDSSTWHASLPIPGDMIIGSYGDNTYPILMWNPNLNVVFKVGSHSGLSSNTLIVDNSKDLVRLKVINTTGQKIAFSVRSYRQSLMFRSHVIFPKAGLHLLDPQQEWSIEVELMRAGEGERDEYICIDLLVCQLNCTPSWNVHRRYAVLKQSHDQHKLIKKLSHNEQVILPGSIATQKDLENSLKQVILHGLQCVVKNKLDQAEIIFTQALHLPLFQRVPLKAFAYICLAVTANKRRKKGPHVNRVGHVLKLVNSMDKLIDACESSPNMRMPKVIALNKQLKKELNPAKVIKDQRQNSNSQILPAAKSETTKEVFPTGDELDLLNTSLTIPGGALPQPVNITLSHLNPDQIHQSLQSSPWSSMLNIISAISIHCSPPVERFWKTITITIILPRDMIPRSRSAPLRLLQSNYMSTWIDITDDPKTEIDLNYQTGILTVKTDQTGWLVVASLQIDMNKILPIAVKSAFTEELITMDINAYGYIFPDGTHAQISVFITPHKENETNDTHPTGHRQIAFPHTFKAYKGQKVRLTLEGQFEPDYEAGQTSLESDIKVDGYMRDIYEKIVKLSSNSKGLYGKLTLSTFCASHQSWEKIQELNLSSPTSAYHNTVD